MAIQELKTQIGRLPEQPGVYLFSNGEGETIYVGKARSLRDRARSYLGARGSSPKTNALLEEARGLEVILTDSVVEALVLENHLIKQRMPKYNVLLRDDKNYPYLKLTTKEDCPRVLVARRVERDGNVYAGPFLPARLARRTMALTHRLFGIRSCHEDINGRRGRPCLEYDIKRCIAPCVEELCSREKYARAVEHTRLFLERRNDALIDRLRDQMAQAAEAERFEEAAHVRDAIRTVETLRDRQQKMATPGLGDRDVFGMQLGAAGAVIQVFQVRRGRVIERVELAAETGQAAADEREVLQAAVQQFYEAREAPPEIHVPVGPAEVELLASWLSGRAGRRVRIVVPKRGEKRALLDLAARNAAMGYQNRFRAAAAVAGQPLELLRVALLLPSAPRRIECFDISTIQGSETVASLVVCEEGRMRRAEYRKYRIRGIRRSTDSAQSSVLRPQSPVLGPQPPPFGADDFAAMHEVVRRRYRSLVEQGGRFPDLILVDGGRGQLSAAYQALEELGLANLVAVALAKKEEAIFSRHRTDPIVLPSNSPALLLLERIRDEAHRFAVTFHRRARAMRDLRSELDKVPGVGPRRRKTLLATFGSLAGVRRASREALASAVGPRVADLVRRHLRDPRDP